MKENPNIEWAAIFVDELVKGGLISVCLAPGSRSTPLALAFYTHSDLKIYTHLDERSAAYFALGLSLAEEKPTALVCTSGTAAGNFLPAVIEANMSQVPLLVLTADRPHELRHSGANQTIDQVKMFAGNVRWSIDMALPHDGAPASALRNWRSLAARALSTANSLVKGPVHINFPFRKPLEPANTNWSISTDFDKHTKPHTFMEHGILQATDAQITSLSHMIQESQRGLIICGPGCPRGNFPEAVTRLSRASGYPVLADPLSGVRYGSHVERSAVIGAYETFLQEENVIGENPEIILRFGQVPTSKWLNRYLEKHVSTSHVHIRESGKWADENHTTNYFLQANEINVCSRVTSSISRPLQNSWLSSWLDVERNCREIFAQLAEQMPLDAATAASLFDQLPNEAVIFSGNSLPIRHIDQFCLPSPKSIDVFSNRGASGIDGNISTGLGIAARIQKPFVLLVGDITFYHDSNGLRMIKKYGLDNVIVVIINNNGGGIFRRLPIAQFEPAFEELFLTPHGLNFEAVAAQYGLNYYTAASIEVFKQNFAEALNKKVPAVIEIQSDSRHDDQARRAVVSLVNSKQLFEKNK
ncbi:MAG: 2-succinyl-5-enolpyruvyl-6-hydroxy-3-cyclohexene-1-carboxylic-acid synthase [Candidatus Promineifilaceae bacterium]|nr:2-succinyl-5-enolpyruvyl-6-hydroxy-3-cyclohexene-1-carboxylic-acid synthase [Candidatus Promineifilaceae bacterium]